LKSKWFSEFGDEYGSSAKNYRLPEAVITQLKNEKTK
jgi:hypothetical protein